MTQQTINQEGAFQQTQRKQINDNFTELYASVTGGTGNIITSNIVANGLIASAAGNGITAAGTTRADALQLVAQWNNVTVITAGTGVILPTSTVGTMILVANNDASGTDTLQVYAGGSATINGTAGSTGVTLAAAKYALYWYVATNVWISVTIN